MIKGETSARYFSVFRNIFRFPENKFFGTDITFAEEETLFNADSMIARTTPA